MRCISMAIKVNGTIIDSLNIGNTQIKKVLVRENESSNYTVVYLDGYVNIPIYNVVQVSSTTSQQFLQNSSGYYESQCKNINSGWSLCKVEFNRSGTYTIQCISNSESNYDYGLLSTLNSQLSASNTADTSNVKKSFKGSSSTSVQSITYTDVKTGDYIYIKYIKDNSVNSGNDSLQFKVTM